MILADQDAIDERQALNPAATQDQFPAIAAPRPSLAEAAQTPQALEHPAPQMFGQDSAARTGLDVVHELMQPGSGHAISSGFQAGVTRAQEVDNATADTLVLTRQYAPVLEAINKDLPREQQLPNPYLNAHLEDYGVRHYGPLGLKATREQLENDIWARVAEMRTANPGAAGNIPASKDELLRDAMAEQHAALDYSELTAQSKIGGIANFVGGFVGGFTDPPNILAMALGAPASSSLLKTFLIEGGLNTALDAAGLPSRAARYRKLGVPMDGKQIAGELAADFVLGGLLPTGAKAISHALVTPEIRAAARVVEDEHERAAENPHGGDDQGRDLMRQGALTAMNALDEGRPDLLPDTRASLSRALDPKIDEARRRRGFSVESFDVAKLQTDAAAMQYKGGADESGVTDRLQGVTQWDPAKAGLSLVWEKADGTAVVADGHQRLGLARRALQDGQDVPFYGVRYREADGFTAQDMRVIAALKNIAEGSGTGIDAARLLREAPDGIGELPPRSPLVRQARDLANLSDDAFGMAINGHASERDAALVGALVKDSGLQAPILAHLAQHSPDTAEEAELFVRQALAAGATSEVQTDMFGDFLKSDLILPQRVKILKGALTALRRDKALFTTLTERAGAIEAAGNKLNISENAARSETAARAFATLKALAERKGTISDALQKAAEDASRGGDRRAATRAFVQDVRDAVERGELDRPEPGGAIGDVEPAAESAAGDFENLGPTIAGGDQALDHHALKLFGDPVDKPDAFLRQSQDLAREIAPPKAEPAIITELKRPFNMTLQELDDAIADERMSDHALLVKALGSEEAAKEFERLDRKRNNTMDTKRADEGAAEFEAKFGNLSPSQERLIYGVAGEGDMPAEDLRLIRAAKEYADNLTDASDQEVARVLTRGMLDVSPEAAARFFKTGEATAAEQAAILRIQAGLQELAARGSSKAKVNGAIAIAMEARGFNLADAVEVLDKWQNLKREPATSAAKQLPAPTTSAPEFGDAQGEIEAMRALDQAEMFPDPAGLGETSVRDARRQMEREARAVEALRKCQEGE